MSIERIFRCDGPDCERHVRTKGEQPPTFLTLMENPGFPHERGSLRHFCGYDCLLKHAGEFPPEEMIACD